MCFFLQVTHTTKRRAINNKRMLTLKWRSCPPKEFVSNHNHFIMLKKIDATDRDEVQIETEETQRLKITR